LPKSHERRIHGRRHAGTRIVLEGPTLARIIQERSNEEPPIDV